MEKAPRAPVHFCSNIAVRDHTWAQPDSSPLQRTTRDSCESALLRLRARPVSCDQSHPSNAGKGRSRNVRAGGNGGEAPEYSRFAGGRRLQGSELSGRHDCFPSFAI